MLSEPDRLNFTDRSKVRIIASPDGYHAVSSVGSEMRIPKELFIALREFLETKRWAGSITLQFHRGEIVCEESWARKTYTSS